MTASTKISIFIATTFVVAAGGFAQGQPNPPSYHVIKLDPVAPEVLNAESTGSAVNEFGEVAGRTTNGEDESGQIFAAGLWLPQPAYGFPSGANALPVVVPGVTNRAYGLNNAGQACGIMPPTDGLGGYARAFRWDADTGMVNELGVVGSHQWNEPHSIATAINDVGEVVGYTTVDPYGTHARPFWHAFVHDGTQMSKLDTFDGDYGRAWDINSSGHIVGFATYDDPTAPIWDPLVGEQLHAALWLRQPALGLPAGLHDLTPNVPDDYPTEARAINDLGQVALHYPHIFPDQTYSSVLALWLPEPSYGMPAGLTVLGGIHGSTKSVGMNAMNDRGAVVGTYCAAQCNTFAPIYHGLLYDAAQGQWFDLQSRILPEYQNDWLIERATGINERGEIVGSGIFFDGETETLEFRGFLLVPCNSPEGDADNSGTVDINDIAYVIFRLGETVPADDGADVDRNGVVDINDISFAIFRLGDEGC